MKKITALMMILVMSGSLMACGSGENSGKASETISETSSETAASEAAKESSDVSAESAGEDIMTGAYERPDSPVITEDIRKICEKGFADLEGASYEPVALIGTQVVEGTNYCILFRTAPVVPNAKETYALGYLYEDLKGDVEVTDIVNSTVETNLSDEGNADGGWTQPDSPVMTEDVKNAFEKAVDDLEGASYTPLALLSSQVVSGMNYCIFCETENRSQGAEKSYAFVYLYDDLDGDSEISDIVSF